MALKNILGGKPADKDAEVAKLREKFNSIVNSDANEKPGDKPADSPGAKASQPGSASEKPASQSVQPAAMPALPAAQSQYKMVDPEKAEENERITNLIMQQIKELIEIDNNLNAKNKELENKISENVSTLASTKSMVEQFNSRLENIEKNMEKFMGLYEVVTNRFNPFVEEAGNVASTESAPTAKPAAPDTKAQEPAAPPANAPVSPAADPKPAAKPEEVVEKAHEIVEEAHIGNIAKEQEAIVEDELKKAVQEVMSTIRKYGLEIDGHFWVDDLDKMAWTEPRQEMLTGEVKMWVILASAQAFAVPSVRYGLSMLGLSVQARRGLNFPIIVLQVGEEQIESATLPVVFQAADIYPAGSASFGPKLVAGLHKTVVPTYPPYRLDVYGIPQIGQWFEVGPREDSWQGVIFGTNEPSISFHAVGPAGQLPEKTVLNYAQQGIKIELGNNEYDGWAVQNKLDEMTSYFVKVDGNPGTIMFCPFTEDEETEAYTITLE